MGGTTPGRINTEQRAKADRVRDRLAKEIGDIQAQKNLTAEGKQARLAKAVLKAQANLAQLRTAEAEDVTDRRDQIIQGLFGHTRPDDTRIISVRDAADRAARVKTPDECAALMNRAALHNDDIDAMASVDTVLWSCRLCDHHGTTTTRPTAHSEGIEHLTTQHHATIGITPK